MKKKGLLFLLIGVGIVLAVSLTIFVWTKPTANLSQESQSAIPTGIPGEVVYIPFPEKITVDGDLMDWNEIPTNYVDYGPTPSQNPEENGSFTFQLAADFDNLYINMQMMDQNIIAGKHETNFWNEDSMEFYINASDDLDARAYGPKIFQANINALDIGNTDPAALTITGVNSGDYQVNGFVFKTEKGWAFEGSVPLKDLLIPAHGLEIGFQAQINGASVQDRDVKLIWSKADTTDQSWNLPILFGRALFYELGRKDIPVASGVKNLPAEAPTPTPVVIPPLVSVNQTGYFADGEKIASIASDSLDEVEWNLQDGSGELLMTGKTTIQGTGKDAASGEFVHIIDFSSFQTPGEGYRIVANGIQSVPFEISEDVYSQLEKDAMAYFYNNRSGIPIDAQYVGDAWARAAGHLSDDNITCYKGVDADGVSWPGCDYTLNVLGGWYDAGDFGKYVVNGGISEWTLLNVYEKFSDVYPDSSLKIPEQGNGVSDLLDEARWEMEFLLSMQVPQGQPQAGMVHHKIHDLVWAPMPMIPPTTVENNNDHSMTGAGRYLYPPSTAATLNLAATAAQSARIWSSIDPVFSQRCLTAAETAWEAAVANPEVYAGNTPGEGGGNYPDNTVADEFYWASAELYITTGKEEYKTYLLNSPLFGDTSSFDWGNTAALGTISLAMEANDLPQDKIDLLQNNLVTAADDLLAVQNEDGYAVPLRGEYPWGSNGQILNNTMLIGVAYDITRESEYLDAMRLAMDYIMGRNSLNKSFVSGYGTYAMQHPHHRFWANDPSNGFPPPPPGALSGGPNSAPSDPDALNAGVMNLAPSKRYLDEIGSYSTNEVTINWNAPLVWVTTFLTVNR